MSKFKPYNVSEKYLKLTDIGLSGDRKLVG
jgi:hypothetical protein